MHVNPPNYTPTSEEQDLIWKFRFHLSTDKKALVVFLRCINWETPSEVRQALNLLSVWSPVDGCDALALLTPDFWQPELRRYAVERLQQSSDDMLQLYMLQLVQALKYEDLNEFEAYSDRMLPEETVDVIQSIGDHEQLESMSQSVMSGNCEFLSKVQFISLLNTIANISLFTVSMRSSRTSHSGVQPADPMFVSDTSIGQNSDSDVPNEQNAVPPSRSQGNIASLSASLHQQISPQPPVSSAISNDGDSPGIACDSDVQSATTSAADEDSRNAVPVALYTFLIERAGRNPHLANYLYWYLSTECDSNDEAVRKPDVRVQRMYERMLKLLKRSLATGALMFGFSAFDR